jgi:hypothetical protein
MMKTSNVGVAIVLLAGGIVVSAGWLLTPPSPGSAVENKPLPGPHGIQRNAPGVWPATDASQPTGNPSDSVRPALPSARVDRLMDGDEPGAPRIAQNGRGPADPLPEAAPQAARAPLPSSPPASSPAAPSAMVPAAGLPTGVGGTEIAVAVPPGERAPAVFYDESPRPEPQMRMLDQIAREFNDLVAQPVPGYTAEQIWRAARDWADERYLYFFGWDAWHALHLSAAKEAVREKEALGQLQQRSYE